MRVGLGRVHALRLGRLFVASAAAVCALALAVASAHASAFRSTPLGESTSCRGAGLAKSPPLFCSKLLWQADAAASTFDETSKGLDQDIASDGLQPCG